MSALEEYNAYVGAADGHVTRDLADAAIAELLAEVERLKEENRQQRLDWQKRQDKYEDSIRSVEVGYGKDIAKYRTAIAELLAEVERLQWIVDQYQGFCHWHSYIPSADELGKRYDREHAAKDPGA